MDNHQPPMDPTDQPGRTVSRLLHMADHGVPQAQRVVMQMRTCWDGLRRGRAIPERADVDPAKMRGILDFAFILERIAPGAARFRLAGRHLVDLMGMEVRGMPLCAFLNPKGRGRLSDVLESVFKGPQIVDLTLHGPAEYGRPELTGRLLLLPLRSDLGDVTRALGCLVTQGEIGLAPRRFDITAETLAPVITGGRVLQPSPSGFAEKPAPWRAPLLQTPLKPLTTDATPDERRARFRVISTD